MKLQARPITDVERTMRKVNQAIAAADGGTPQLSDFIADLRKYWESFTREFRERVTQFIDVMAYGGVHVASAAVAC